MKQFEVNTDQFLILHNLIRPFIIFDKVGCIKLESTDKEVNFGLRVMHAYSCRDGSTDEVFLF